MAGILDRIFSGDARILKKIKATALKIDALKDTYRQLSDEQLKEKTTQFKERLLNGETLDDIKIEAFATSREACYRVRKEFPYVVQLMGALVMHDGDIAEMKTGEGKTLTSVMCVYLNALTGKGVHVVTVNEYLAQRDAQQMGEIHSFLGLSVGVNLRTLTSSEKREVYRRDITYTTNSELGFDYLRDNMAVSKDQKVIRELYYAVVDEVDSILIDESRTPLIISGGKKQTRNLYIDADRFAKLLKNSDFEIDIKTKQIFLKDTGVNKAEKMFNVKNLYDIEHTQLVHHIQQALKANYVMEKDVEYMVSDDEILIIDSFTGRAMPGRQYSDGLHQAIEAKEHVSIKEETSTLATITYQNFFRLYHKLSGMTGTAKTEEEEFLSIYNMRVLEIDTNVPIARIDYPDSVYGTKEDKFEALADEVAELHEKGRPVLVGTISVETSEQVSQLLKRRRIPHEVLNAKNHEREADIVAKAGQKNAVTIATNMAGRGTDIKLSDETRALGGLVVLGSERHESRRIDNQLRGRSGRQGDPGYSRFYVSIEDDLIVRFGVDKLLKSFVKFPKGQSIQSKTISRQIGSAQRKVEGHNFDMRKTLIDYDDVLRRQREVIYELRDTILDSEDSHEIIRQIFERVLANLAQQHFDPRNEEIDIESMKKSLKLWGIEDIDLQGLRGLSLEEAREKTYLLIWELYSEKIKDIFDAFKDFEKRVLLQIIDRNWVEHIDSMTKLREGIHLRSYAQSNPLQVYVHEGFEMFEMMINTIDQEVVNYLLRVQIRKE